MTGIEVTGVGLLVTVQDLGRTGFLGQGITTGGAVDGFALQCANRLVGNPDSLAGLEIVLAGMQLTLREQATVAFYGASVPIQVDGEGQDMEQPINVAAGCAIDVGASRTGTYTYMAVRGGIDTPPVLGSRSTVVRESLGGLMGRGLKTGMCCQSVSPQWRTPAIITCEAECVPQLGRAAGRPCADPAICPWFPVRASGRCLQKQSDHRNLCGHRSGQSHGGPP